MNNEEQSFPEMGQEETTRKDIRKNLEGLRTKYREYFLTPQEFILGSKDQTIEKSPAYQNSLSTIRERYKEAVAWHGTGRLQYDPHHPGLIRDVLNTVIQEGGLIPHPDHLDFTLGEIDTISTTPSRLYAEMYAQTHYEKGKQIFNKRQNGFNWMYYLAPIAAIGAYETFIKRNPNYLQLLNMKIVDKYRSKAYKFHDKYTTESVTKNDMLTGGMSNIPGNYPLLIGIKQDGFSPLQIAEVIRAHEMRSAEPIPISAFTHIEAPLSQTQSVKDFLVDRNIDLPVIPIEWGNEYSKSQPLSYILEGKPAA